jgi:hypothetical protein
MTWYIIGAIITFFATCTESDGIEWYVIVLGLCGWPIIFGFFLNDVHRELVQAREARTDIIGDRTS